MKFFITEPYEFVPSVIFWAQDGTEVSDDRSVLIETLPLSQY